MYMATTPVPVKQHITKEQLTKALPKTLQSSVSDKLIDSLNKLMNDPELSHNFRDNLLGYTSVMREGKFKLTDYINAVRYVSYKLLGASNIEAYTKTFPDRYKRMINDNVPDRQIASFVAAYNRTKLVNLVYEQTLVPTHVLNADLHQKAINVLAELMLTARSEKVRADAANSLVTHLKPPETRKFELDIAYKEDKSISELREATIALAAQQREMIKAGMKNAQEIAHEKVINGEYSDV